MMKRLLVVASMSLVATVGLNAGVAGAARPVNQACVGESLSALASDQPFPGAFGEGVTSFAQEPGPHGANIQAFQAGEVPDEIVPNTCND